MPAVQARLARFEAAHTQVLGVSVDSIYCHANWARSLGGISFPLLADFHPKGDVARRFGLYLEDKGITDRATVIVSRDGIVRFAESVTPAGERDIDALVAECERIDREHPGGEPPARRRLPDGSVLFVKTGCPFCRWVLAARENLGLTESLPVRNVSEDPQARAELERIAGRTQVPCLVREGEPMHESAEIARFLAELAAPVH
ncbi:MAG: hypothetical protein D6718_07620 [Acidobacteria bacterium]|nr:MAG: hypothetical protein D6718_07620 [Acidobacteriota bacterium]